MSTSKTDSKRLYECARQAEWLAKELDSIYEATKNPKLSSCVLYADTLSVIKTHLILLSQNTNQAQ